jgi:hypothetical protein
VRACAHCRRFLDQVRTEKKIKSDQARRQEAEREWKATEEAEHQRRKIKAYYRAEDLATLDDPAVGRRSSGRAKIRGLKLDVDAAAMASEDEDGPSARSGLRSNEVELADGARRGGGRPQKGQDSRERDEATSPAQDEATARDLPREVDAGRDALSKDEIAAALSKIRHRRYLAVKEFLDAGTEEGPAQMHAAQKMSAAYVRKHGQDTSKPGVVRIPPQKMLQHVEKVMQVSTLVGLLLLVGESKPDVHHHI